MRSRSYGMRLMNRKRASLIIGARTQYRRIAGSQDRGLLAGLRLDPPDGEALARVFLDALAVYVRVGHEDRRTAGEERLRPAADRVCLVERVGLQVTRLGVL